jgi:hypothetical protein
MITSEAWPVGAGDPGEAGGLHKAKFGHKGQQ